MTKIDFTARGAGKTTRMIYWLKENPKHLLIVMSNAEEQRLKRQYPEVKNQIIDWYSYQRAHNNGFFEIVSIDNADQILQNMVRQPINTMSITDGI